MSGMQPNRPSFVVYLLALALSFTGLAEVSRARTQDIPQNGAQDLEQEKEKKEEKKDDKKDEKKGLPLKSDRKVSFTTDEGTWLSLDVSPDGKTIAFELLGDIYTLPIEGGKAKLICGGMSFDSQPKFSPDGQWIAFLSDRESKYRKIPTANLLRPVGTPKESTSTYPKPISESALAKSGCTTWMAGPASRSPNQSRRQRRRGKTARASWVS